MIDPRSEYFIRLNRVLDTIQANLDQTLSLEILAAEAGFSPFHFHRLFKGMMGETLNDYVQRVRLERAANLLLYHPMQPILEIALACGFSGAAVFSRAFKMHFGISPSGFRGENRKNRKVESKQGKELTGSFRYNGSSRTSTDYLERSNSQMNVEVKTLPTYHVAYIRNLSGYSKGVFNSELNQAFQRVCGWAVARDLFGPNTLVIGIPYDNPDITPNDRCRYDACVTVPEAVKEGTGEVGIGDISGGKYAVGRISISSSETHKIGAFVDGMYGEWLPSSGYIVDDRPALEIYYENPDHAPGEWITMDYCIPVRPL